MTTMTVAAESRTINYGSCLVQVNYSTRGNVRTVHSVEQHISMTATPHDIQMSREAIEDYLPLGSYRKSNGCQGTVQIIRWMLR
jgi:hypothetical protein